MTATVSAGFVATPLLYVKPKLMRDYFACIHPDIQIVNSNNSHSEFCDHKTVKAFVLAVD